MVNRREFPLAEVYRLLESGPVVLVTTCRAGRANLMPMSWHTMMEFVPPLVGCVISDQNYTFEVLRATGECVLNVPTVELAKKVVACGNARLLTILQFCFKGLVQDGGEQGVQLGGGLGLQALQRVRLRLQGI